MGHPLKGNVVNMKSPQCPYLPPTLQNLALHLSALLFQLLVNLSFFKRNFSLILFPFVHEILKYWKMTLSTECMTLVKSLERNIYITISSISRFCNDNVS